MDFFLEVLAMNGKISRTNASLWVVFASPIDRLRAGAVWTEAGAAIGAAFQYAYHDAFIGALAFVLVGSMADYVLGVKAARFTGAYSADTAKRGALGKASGILLLVLIRSFEHYLFLQHVTPNTRGIVATGVAVSLFAVDLESIAHHREELGAKPIPVLGRLFSWFQAIAGSKIPPDPAAKP